MGDVEPTFRLVCMMGLPRSGKTTAARKLSKILGAPIVNRDSIRLALHGQRYQKLAEPMVKAIALVMVRALFEAGHRVVIVDETNIRRSTRDFWCDEAWVTEILSVPTLPRVCLRRAKAVNDKAIQSVIKSMTNRWEVPEPDERRFDLEAVREAHPEVAEVIESIKMSMDGADIEG